VARASYVVVVSRATQQHLRELVGEELAAKAVCIYNGVDRRLLSQRQGQHSRGAPLLLGVGRLVEKKGFAHLLAAADLLRARGLEFRLAIAGDGPLRRALEQQAADLSLPVRFLGPLPHDQVKRAMAGAYAVVLPAIVAADGDRDVLPTVLLEAQALAKPVVATRLTGIPEIVDDGATGLLVPEDSAELPAALAGALQQLLRDPEFSHRLGTAGRERMAARFALASSVTALAACMRGEGAPLVGMEAT